MAISSISNNDMDRARKKLMKQPAPKPPKPQEVGIDPQRDPANAREIIRERNL